MLLDIVILPPVWLRERLGKQVVKATRGIPSVFIVDNKKLIPHLNLFHVQTIKGRIKKLELRIRAILKRYRPIKIRKIRIHWQGGGFIGFTLSKPRILTQLHREIVKQCHGLRLGAMPWPGLKPPTKDKVALRRKYGSSFLHKYFRPHFTLAFFKNENDVKKVAGRLRREKFAFQADTIAITEVNFWHQVTRVIKKFKLK